MRAENAVLRRGERIAERLFGLRHGADCGPLLHVACYYGFLVTLRFTGSILPDALWVALWCLLTLLNFSLTIGIHHLHGHRPIFRHAILNRLFEFTLTVPSLLTHTEMIIFHVHHHHAEADGAGDAGSTRGRERGWAAVRYILTYFLIVRVFVTRALREPRYRSSPLRVWYYLHFLGALAFVALFFWGEPWLLLWLWGIPMLITLANTGYFSWLTHAPAHRTEGEDPNGSLNNSNNLLNLFIFNQGYHAVHHARPAVHWSDIPSHFDVLRDVDDGLIVPYWLTLQSSWRLARGPEAFRDAEAGRSWKERLARRGGRHRLPLLSYFGWV